MTRQTKPEGAHTPGPEPFGDWRITGDDYTVGPIGDENDLYIVVRTGDGGDGGTVYVDGTPIDSAYPMQVARLIASAPQLAARVAELEAALRGLVDEIRSRTYYTQEIDGLREHNWTATGTARAVLAKGGSDGR